MKPETCLLEQVKAPQWNSLFEFFRRDEAVNRVLRHCPDQLLCCRFNFVSSQVSSRWAEVIGIWNFVLEQCPYRQWPQSPEVQMWNRIAQESALPIYFSSIGEMVLK